VLLVWPLRDDGPPGAQPLATIAIMLASTGASLWLWSLPADAAAGAVHWFGLIPADLLHPRLSTWVATLTSLVLHAGWSHLLINLAYLWLFGRGLEAALGHWRVLVLFTASGLAGELAQILTVPTSHLPMIGASGGISGVLGAYLVLFPRANILTLTIVWRTRMMLNIPSIIAIAAWLMAELASLIHQNIGRGGTASAAHLGGFVTGLLLMPLLRTPGLTLLQPARTLAFSSVRSRGTAAKYSSKSASTEN
jgi:membrane associated rhomboid family serine protease